MPKKKKKFDITNLNSMVGSNTTNDNSNDDSDWNNEEEDGYSTIKPSDDGGCDECGNTCCDCW
jgi:hypothetical protein